jgi:hypothetical protein
MSKDNNKVEKSTETVQQSTDKVPAEHSKETAIKDDNPTSAKTGVEELAERLTTSDKIDRLVADIAEGNVEPPCSIIDYVPSGPRVLIEMTFPKFPTRLLLNDKLPDDLPIRPIYRVIGVGTEKSVHLLGKTVTLDMYSGGSETKIVDERNPLNFLNMRKYVSEMDNTERGKIFQEQPNIRVVEHFVILEGNIAAFKK